jgi:cytochrome oxidase Cu insertion factor (SCO1/SenC/PrrC family)
MSEEENQKQIERKSRRTLLLVAAVCIAPFVGSFALYFFWQPSGRVNYGDLIEGVALPAAKLTLTDGKPFELEKLRGKWLFITVDSGGCDEYCQKKLWKMRQVRMTQGKFLERIERVWLVSDAQGVAPALMKEYDGTHVVAAQSSALLKAFPVKEVLRDHIYLVDPLGNIVLRYPKDADPTGMKKDLVRVLKVSRIG